MERTSSGSIRELRDNRAKKRDLISFWILGLCNNYGYVVMLTAAADIIHSDSKSVEFSGRWCTPISTGAILLADIIPSFIIKGLSPFLPYNANIRVSISCFLSIIGFLSVAFASSRTIVIIGVVITSFSAGLGEPTFLAHSTLYNKNVVSTWSSGTGGAGVVGALSYSVLREIGLNSRQTLLIMLVVPTVEFFTFFFLLSKRHLPHVEPHSEGNASLLERESGETHASEDHLDTLKQKLAFIPKLMIYFVPLTSVYFFEYFINQGLFELVTFNNISLDPAQQYRWYQVTYQVGVFISRSSVNLIQFKHTYVMAIIQGFFSVLFLLEAIYLFIPDISIVFVLIFFEGLQGGFAYVNTYYKMSQEIAPSHRQFAMNVVASSDSVGIILAGFLAIPTHNWICQMPGMLVNLKNQMDDRYREQKTMEKFVICIIFVLYVVNFFPRKLLMP